MSNPAGDHPRHSPHDLEARRRLRRETRANQTYQSFLKELSTIGRMSPEFAERAAASVLATLEHRLVGGEAADLNAQLPLKLTDLLAKAEAHADAAEPKYGPEEFIQFVADDLGVPASEAEPIIRKVINVIRNHVSEGEWSDVLAQLPKSFEELLATEH